MDKHTLLLVDDEPFNLRVLTELLADDYELFVAASGEEALRIATATPPHLVLLDVMMPGMDGFSVCEALKAGEKTANVPVIFLTAMDDAETEKRGLALGAVDFVRKPFDSSILNARIKVNIELSRYRQQLEDLIVTRTGEVSALQLAAEKASQQKSEFIANLHNCLKNPLNAIQGFAQLLLDDNFSAEERKSFVDLIGEQSGTLEHLLRAMLDYVALDEILATDSGEKLSVQDICNEVLDLCQMRAFNRRMKLDDQTRSIGTDTVFLHRGNTRRTLVELINNAISYSPEGSTITLKAAALGGVVRIEVIDQGAGIAEEEVAKAFLPFNRLGAGTGRGSSRSSTTRRRFARSFTRPMQSSR